VQSAAESDTTDPHALEPLDFSSNPKGAGAGHVPTGAAPHEQAAPTPRAGDASVSASASATASASAAFPSSSSSHPSLDCTPSPSAAVVELIYQKFVSDLCDDVVFEVHRAAKTGEITMEELYTRHSGSALQPLLVDGASSTRRRPAARGTDLYGQVPPRDTKFSFPCANCGQKVSVLRYAPHLDKCMGKSRARYQRSTPRLANPPSNAERRS